MSTGVKTYNKLAVNKSTVIDSENQEAREAHFAVSSDEDNDEN